ncbi:hypothetical protein N7486_001445 [Penicillium sp. IBT 16267x]|nr:hypothetical protein N7486_001445 [Penicillium sp. IBT 16267x]
MSPIFTGYTIAELQAGVAINTGLPPPHPTPPELFDVLYVCNNTSGGIVANVLCLNGCTVVDGILVNDQCRQPNGGTGTVTTTTTVTTTFIPTGTCDWKNPLPILCWGCCIPKPNQDQKRPSVTSYFYT